MSRYPGTFPCGFRLSNHRLSCNCHDYLTLVQYGSHFQTKAIFFHCAWHNICISQSTGRILLRTTPTTSRTINSFRSFLFNITSRSGKSRRRYGDASCEIYLCNLAIARILAPIYEPTRISVHYDGQCVRCLTIFLLSTKKDLIETAFLKKSTVFYYQYRNINDSIIHLISCTFFHE